MRSPSSRRLVSAVVVVGVALGCAGCGGSSSGTPGAATPSASTSPSGTPLATGVSGKGNPGFLSASVTACLKTHGAALPAGATAKQVRNAFRALPLAKQQSAFTACESLLPVLVRQIIQQDLAKEKEPG
jgi:hypothetical protein